MSSTDMSERAFYMETSIHMMEVTSPYLILAYAWLFVTSLYSVIRHYLVPKRGYLNPFIWFKPVP
jgi:hypothetical protein